MRFELNTCARFAPCRTRSIGAVLLVFACTIGAAQEEVGTGHSKHGTAFDSGMRIKPWEMPGIGSAPFPITVKTAEVQKWFDQGNALLHSFWFEEAERSFRWCLKLDPENAMAYWSLARCGFNWFSMESTFEGKRFDRYKAFLKEAVKRKDKVTERERMYIEAWEKATAPGSTEHAKTINDNLQKIIIKFPDDVEAKALLALFEIGYGSAYSNELVIQQVLAKNPLHPGAHHASIHNWDGVSSEQAINSCELYSKSAPEVGHAMHMPGHIYSKIGMWHEAAIAMDSATRIELRYMNDRLALPFETWNYPHNRNYLCYIQEQLGMAEASLQGARDMLSAPRDPEHNPDENGRIVSQGKDALIRALIKFEKWDEILAPGGVPWGDGEDFGKFLRAYAESFALNGLGRTGEAKDRLSDMRSLARKMNTDAKGDELPQWAQVPIDNVEGLIFLSEGNVLDGQRLLLNAADEEQKERDGRGYGDDPPSQPWPLMRLLGDHYRKHGDQKLAIECYERALRNEPNDGFSLSGLALSHFAVGDKERATYYAGRLSYVWSQADRGLKWLEDVERLGLNPPLIAETPRKERKYLPQELDALGPMSWQPFSAPKLDVVDREGKPVRLEDYAGKNVVLVFFLGEACVHCVGQLNSINGRMSDLGAQDTVVLAVCSATPESLKASVALEGVNVTFLSDKAHENARRFASYDDFEGMELHSTILIDKTGRVRWKRTGGDPFTDIDFLINEIKRCNKPG